MVLFLYDELIRQALQEDLGTGDVTTESLITEGEVGRGSIIAKERFVLAGLDVGCRVFSMLSDCVVFDRVAQDGDVVEEGQVITKISGPFAVLLQGERVALNFLQHLSGVATLTHRFVQAISGTRARIVSTRKTMPGLRQLEKYAVRVGGGWNHRRALSEGVLVKENHITACGGIPATLERLKRRVPHTLKIEIEVRTLQEVSEVLQAGVDMVLLDNMCIEEIRQAVEMVKGKIPLEASGNVDLENVLDIARAGVDYISVGRLTHSAPAVDMSILLEHG